MTDRGLLRGFVFGFPLLLAALLFGATSTSAAADDSSEARAWLDRMTRSMHELDYQGTFVYMRGSEVDTMRLTHAQVDGVAHERMVAVSGPHREVLRDGQGVRAIVGDEQQPTPGPLLNGAAFPDFTGAALQQALDRYTIEMGKTGRIAGHESRKISIRPKDNYRYGYDLWLEQATALILRWVLYDTDSQPLAKLMFTDLVTGEAVDRSGLQTSARSGQYLAVSQAAPRSNRASELAVLQTPDGVPPGFRLAAHARTAEGDQPLEHLVFTDGLASVSVYLEAVSTPGGVAPGLSRLGTTNVWSRSEGERRVTTVGEVPPMTLTAIGEAFLAQAASR